MTKYLHRLFGTFAVLFIFASTATATQYQTDASGAWTAAATWQGGLVPPNILLATDSVTIDHNVTLANDLVLTPGARLTINGPGHLDLSGFRLFNQSNGGGGYLGGINIFGQLTVDYVRNYGFSWIFIEPGGILTVNGNVDNLGDIYVSGTMEVINGDFNHRAADIWVFTGGTISITNGDFNNYSTIRNLFPTSCIGILDGSFINHRNAFVTGSGAVAAANNVDNSANSMTAWNGVNWCAGNQGINVDPLLEDCSGPCNLPLPVEIVHFDAIAADDGAIRVEWTTATETNSERFRVERSKDLVEFELVGEVDAAGNSDVLRNYELMDKDHEGGLVHYRLTEIDLEGAERTHGQYVSAFTELAAQPFVAYPNPARDQLTVEVDPEMVGSAILQMTDLRGAEAVTMVLESPQQQLDLSPFPRGIYLLQLRQGSRIDAQKIILE